MIACSATKPQEQAMTPEPTGPLTVSLTCDRASTGAQGEAPCTITIRNAADAPVRLNKRLLVAYEPVVDRDVYFEITRDGAPYVGTDQYDRTSAAKALDEGSYRTLAPGEAITKQIDLHGYYRFPPGSYRIRAVYAPQKSDADRDAWSGSARSNEVSLEVK
jgi:hypothetical protein